MIKLIEGYAISGNPKDYTLKIDTGRKDKKTGEEVYSIVGYYGTVSGCIEACYKDICRKKVQINVYDLKTALEAFKKVENALKEIIPEQFK